MIVIQEIRDKAQWNEFLLAQPTQAGIFLQSWEWGEFQKAVGRPAQISASQKFQSGRRVYRYQAEDSFAQVIEVPLPFGKKYWFIPRGGLIEGLDEEARKRGALFVRFEPVHDMVPAGAIKTKHVSPPQTLIVDLNKSEEELLAAMHEKTRYNIRLALKRGIEVREMEFSAKGGSASGGEEFWKLMQETARRDKFRTHPAEYYKTMLGVLGPTPLLNPPPLVGGGRVGGEMHVRFHATYHGSVMLAAAIVAYFGDTATYLHGASSYEHRALMGPYALHWEIMREAKKRGYKYYDFWGIRASDGAIKRWSDKDPWAGMTRFKMGFASPDVKVGASPDRSVGSGHIINYPGTFDLPLNKFWYSMYRVARRLL